MLWKLAVAGLVGAVVAGGGVASASQPNYDNPVVLAASVRAALEKAAPTVEGEHGHVGKTTCKRTTGQHFPCVFVSTAHYPYGLSGTLAQRYEILVQVYDHGTEWVDVDEPSLMPPSKPKATEVRPAPNVRPYLLTATPGWQIFEDNCTGSVHNCTLYLMHYDGTAWVDKVETLLSFNSPQNLQAIYYYRFFSLVDEEGAFQSHLSTCGSKSMGYVGTEVGDATYSLVFQKGLVVGEADYDPNGPGTPKTKLAAEAWFHEVCEHIPSGKYQ